MPANPTKRLGAAGPPEEGSGPTVLAVGGEGAMGVTAAVVAAERDRVIPLAAQLLRTVRAVPGVAVMLDDPALSELFEGIDVGILDDRSVPDREVGRTLFGEPT